MKIREFFKVWYVSNDAAHQIEHADAVYDLALSLNKKMDYNLKEEHIALAAYAHDIRSDLEGRKYHNVLAHDMILERNSHIAAIFSDITDEDLHYIAKAVLEHRASYKGEYTSNLSLLISAADRGPIDYNIMYERSLKYNKGYHAGVLQHMKEKFGYGGYAKYPKFYEEMMCEEIKELKERIKAQE